MIKYRNMRTAWAAYTDKNSGGYYNARGWFVHFQPSGVTHAVFFDRHEGTIQENPGGSSILPKNWIPV